MAIVDSGDAVALDEDGGRTAELRRCDVDEIATKQGDILGAQRGD
jgi:hypothetical protein